MSKKNERVYGGVWVKIPVEVDAGSKVYRSFLDFSVMLENPYDKINRKIHIRKDTTGEIKVFSGDIYIKKLDIATKDMMSSERELLYQDFY